MTTIFVRNNDDTELVDKYDGLVYRFPVGELTECPIEAVRHIFGYGESDKSRALIRLGWSKMTNGSEFTLDAAMLRLGKYQFLAGVTVPEEQQTAVPEAGEEAHPAAEQSETLHLPPKNKGGRPKKNLLEKAAALRQQSG